MPDWQKKKRGILRSPSIDAAMPQIASWLGEQLDPGSAEWLEVREQLADCWSEDAYEWARNLERWHGWAADTRLVNILEGA
jgi:hypothetical protein